MVLQLVGLVLRSAAHELRLVPILEAVVALAAVALAHVDVQLRRPLMSSWEAPVVSPAPLP